MKCLYIVASLCFMLVLSTNAAPVPMSNMDSLNQKSPTFGASLGTESASSLDFNPDLNTDSHLDYRTKGSKNKKPKKNSQMATRPTRPPKSKINDSEY